MSLLETAAVNVDGDVLRNVWYWAVLMSWACRS